MKPFEKLDKSNIKQVRQVVADKLKELEALGLKVDLGNIKYDSGMFSTKMTAHVTGGKEIDPLEIARKEWDTYCYKFEFEKSDFGRLIQQGAKRYQIVGLKPRSRKSPIIIKEIVTGTSYVTSISGVKRNFID